MKNLLSGNKAQLRQILKDLVVIHKKDAEVAEFLGIDRSAVTKWRLGTRAPNFGEVLEYEEKLGLPFECFMSREPNLESIKEKLESQFNAVKKLMMEN